MTPVTIRLLLAAHIAVAPTTFPSAQQPDPGVRNAHAAVYEARRHTLLVFGGATATEVRGDLWRWRDGSWRRSPANGPAPRTFPAMVFDSARGEVVLFGGSRVLFGDGTAAPAMLDDTWILRRDQWIRVSGRGPGPRAEAAVAYDARRGRTVMFGGRVTGQGGKVERLGDTWEWDGRRWTRASISGPSPRSGAAMAWHPELGAVVLFGGSSGPLGDTWSWDGRAWTRLPVAPAPGRFNAVMAWDPSSRRLVRFGGWNGTGRTSDTWELHQDQWALVQDAGPAARNHAVLVSAPDRGSLLLFGGHDGDAVFGDLWEWRNGRWTLLQGVPRRSRVLNGH